MSEDTSAPTQLVVGRQNDPLLVPPSSQRLAGNIKGYGTEEEKSLKYQTALLENLPLPTFNGAARSPNVNEPTVDDELVGYWKSQYARLLLDEDER